LQKIYERSKCSTHRHPANKPNTDEARQRLLKVWRERLAGCRADAEVHASILAVRSLVLGPRDDYEAILTLSDLSRQAERFKLAERVLLDPLEELGADLNGPIFGFGLDQSMFDGLMVDHYGMDEQGQMSSGPIQQQLSNHLVAMAGGHERYVISIYY
jgi:FAT domain